MDRELPVSSKSGAGDQVVSNSSETNEMKLATLERGRGGEISIIVHCICRAISLSRGWAGAKLQGIIFTSGRHPGAGKG